MTRFIVIVLTLLTVSLFKADGNSTFKLLQISISVPRSVSVELPAEDTKKTNFMLGKGVKPYLTLPGKAEGRVMLLGKLKEDLARQYRRKRTMVCSIFPRERCPVG